MTQSYFETLGRGAGAPPNISDTNYLQTDPTEKMVEVVNKEQDKAIKDNAAFHRDLVRDFNVMHANKMATMNKLIAFIPKLGEMAEKQAEFGANADYLNEIESTSPDAEPDIDAEVAIEDEKLAAPINAEAGRLEADGAPTELVNTAKAAAVQTPGSNYRNGIDRSVNMYNINLAESKRNLIVNGKSYADLLTAEDHLMWIRQHDALMLQELMRQNPGMPRRMLVRRWVPKIKELRASYLNAAASTANTVASNAIATQQKLRLWDSVAGVNPVADSFGPTGYIKNRAAYFEQLAPGSGMKLARNEWVSHIQEGLEQNFITEGQLNTLLDTDFKFNDNSVTTFRKKFPREAQALVATEVSTRSKLFQEQEEINDNRKQIWVGENITNFEGDKTYEWVRSTAKAYREEFQTTEFPEELKRIYTEGYEDEFEKVRRLAHVASTGGKVSMEDISTIANPDLKEQALKLVNQTAVSGLSEEMLTESKDLIKTNIAKYTFENDLNKSKTPKFVSIQRQANKDFQIKFAQLKNQNQDDLTAQRGAEEYVIGKIKNGDYDVLPEYKFDSNAGTDINVARTAIALKPDIVFANVPMAGEQPYLEQAAEFITSNGKRGSIPEYYTLLSKLYPDFDPYDLAKTRLESVGMIKPDKKDGYEGVVNKRLLTDKNTSSKTMRNAFTGENIKWMTTRLENPVAKKHGGFDAVMDKNGEYTQLEKPLSQHTVGEVLGLIQQGHTNFGMYDITGPGLLQIIASNSAAIDVNDLFDENLQKGLLLARLRYKNSLGKPLNGASQFRRLVNIPREEREEFEKLVGILPVYSQLENLLPAVAKAVVEDTLQ